MARYKDLVEPAEIATGPFDTRPVRVQEAMADARLRHRGLETKELRHQVRIALGRSKSFRIDGLRREPMGGGRWHWSESDPVFRKK